MFVKQATATRAPVVWIIHPFHALNVIFTYWMDFPLAGIGSELYLGFAIQTYPPLAK